MCRGGREKVGVSCLVHSSIWKGWGRRLRGAGEGITWLGVEAETVR